MTPAEVLARHSRLTIDSGSYCRSCSDSWPCDAVEMARQAQIASNLRELLRSAVKYEHYEGFAAALGSDLAEPKP